MSLSGIDREKMEINRGKKVEDLIRVVLMRLCAWQTRDILFPASLRCVDLRRAEVWTSTAAVNTLLLDTDSRLLSSQVYMLAWIFLRPAWDSGHRGSLLWENTPNACIHTHTPPAFQSQSFTVSETSRVNCRKAKTLEVDVCPFHFMFLFRFCDVGVSNS